MFRKHRPPFSFSSAQSTEKSWLPQQEAKTSDHQARPKVVSPLGQAILPATRQTIIIMCRMVVFEGICTRCGTPQTWTDLTQELSCLEAKNKGYFGECSRGIHVEEHDFDQECNTCADEDEGIGDLDEALAPAGGNSNSNNSFQHSMSSHQSNPGKSNPSKRGAAEDAGEASKKQRT
ncbi:hypothetical protein CDV31_015319 [Fusarium ambrosium]|nr:hypothetical protein CDV31_015319 [Fusarium ambrosium]